LHTIVGDIGDTNDAPKIVEKIKAKADRVDHIVASLGSLFLNDGFFESTLEEFNKAIHSLAGSHFVAYKNLLPLVRDQEGSSYTFVTGGAGERIYLGKAALTTVGAAALFGISIAAREENENKPVRVNEWRLFNLVTTHEKADGVNSHSNRVGGDSLLDLVASNEKGIVYKEKELK
jgi:NAD(P)-dependent dehydrogenase (short-subunit alcohol dehydrogenase family)